MGRVKRALLFVFLLGCPPKTSAVTTDAGTPTPTPPPPVASSAGVGEDEEEEALLAHDGGACPRPIHPDYCRGRCRDFGNRKAGKHARRVAHSERIAFGKCDTLDVFAEDEQAGDAGVQAGIVEYFDPSGALVAAVDTRVKSCGQFGAVPKCTPQLTWEESRVVTITMGPVEAKTGMPPEVVSRILRQNFGRFRMCAEAAKDARAVGRYGAKIHVAKDGSVSSVEDDGTTIASKQAAECIAKAIRSMSFPEPEGGPMVAKVAIDLKH